MVIQWSFGGHSVVIQWSFGGHLKDIVAENPPTHNVKGLLDNDKNYAYLSLWAGDNPFRACPGYSSGGPGVRGGRN